MQGNKYDYAMAQLVEEGIMHPDAHTFVQDDFYKVEAEAAFHIMMQLSLKRGLEEWGDKAQAAVESE